MITPDFVRTMARYGAWQNENLAAAADPLEDAERRRDRGAFFGSIFGTFNHLLWGDRMWMSRFSDLAPPAVGIGESPRLTDDWAVYRAARIETDAAIATWAEGVREADVTGDLTWFSGAVGRELTRPRGLIITHFFNHGAHHRGQIHAMLTAAGARPGDTDLMLLPPG